ncbi:phage integrase family protein [Bifidobacterium goeldii]|uniref:Phage integrase family protein n=1 Tax=Bifidobacterium goeldii TaxID=2306975 RepID=A0A430FF73_9BIFI|nr:site-specific integrase [Bifidobacterium goeldii]RSX51392.1 phage integrase family protein [Bifidobacterium goeldii]
MAKRKGSRSFGWIRKRPVKDTVNGGSKSAYYASYLNPFDSSERVHAPDRFDTLLDARKWLDEEHRLISSGEWTRPADRLKKMRERGQTFGEFAEKWFDRHKGAWRPRTRETYRGRLNSRLLPVFGNTRLRDISVDMVREWYDGDIAKVPGQRASCYGMLWEIMEEAYKPPYRLLDFNPCTIKGGSRHAGVERPVATPEQVQQIVDAMPERYRLMVLLATWMSMRFGEVRALRRSDIDLSKKEIHITRNVTHTSEDGFVEGAPKTRAGVRTVAIPDSLVPEIRRHIARFAGEGADGLLFRSAGGGYVHQSEVEKAFLKARTAVGLPNLRFHDLRHTGNTIAMQTGSATLADLQARGGWTTPNMVLHYAHSSIERQHGIADALDDVRQGRKTLVEEKPDAAAGHDDDGVRELATSLKDALSGQQALLDEQRALREQNQKLVELLTHVGLAL